MRAAALTISLGLAAAMAASAAEDTNNTIMMDHGVWRCFAGNQEIACGGAEPQYSELLKICRYGYSAAHRMPLAQSMQIKAELMAKYCGEHNIEPCRFGDYELDHIVPLCLGGTNDRDNLQIQTWDRARVKDRLEASTCKAYCTGQISLEDARARFKRD